MDEQFMEDTMESIRALAAGFNDLAEQVDELEAALDHAFAEIEKLKDEDE